MKLQEYEQIIPHVSAEGVTWITPNTQCAWRIETLLTKEPDTIAWLNTMQPGDVLYDVGANMGQYSLLAAKRGVRVHAFEPESQNFALLCRNIAVNDFNECVTPWPIALSCKPGLSTFYVQQLAPGNSCNSYGDSVNYQLRPKEFAFKQGCGAATLDFLATTFDEPTHIKIDVDGFEHKVLQGAKGTLVRVKSVLVETNRNLDEHLEIEPMMAEFGLFPDREAAEKALRRDGPFKDIGNVIYYRRGAK